MITIRPVAVGDLDSCYAISLQTGDAGSDATPLYRDPKLIGHIYVAPYVALEPRLALVAEDDEGVAGYVVGVTDTLAWQARLERDWWPALRRQYADPVGPPEAWTADQRRVHMIFHPERAEPDVVADYPAHLHLNLLPRQQRQGVGTRLIAAWRAAAGDGGRKVHVGVGRSNAGGRRFWESQGFRELSYPSLAGARSLWMGAEG